MASIEERVESLVEKKVNDLGYELYDVEYAKEGKDYYLRIFIDKPEGIDLNDCEKVNDAIIIEWVNQTLKSANKNTFISSFKVIKSYFKIWEG